MTDLDTFFDEQEPAKRKIKLHDAGDSKCISCEG